MKNQTIDKNIICVAKELKINISVVSKKIKHLYDTRYKCVDEDETLEEFALKFKNIVKEVDMEFPYTGIQLVGFLYSFFPYKYQMMTCEVDNRFHSILFDIKTEKYLDFTYNSFKSLSDKKKRCDEITWSQFDKKDSDPFKHYKKLKYGSCDLHFLTKTYKYLGIIYRRLNMRYSV